MVLNTTYCGAVERYRCPHMDRASVLLGHLEQPDVYEVDDEEGLTPAA